MSDSGFSEALANKPLSKMASFSRSERNLSECDSPGPSISRSESMASCASSSCRLPPSPVTPLEVRTLTNNFQKLLSQATNTITELKQEKENLENEQKKLLTTNVNMAIETKKLLLQQKEWNGEKEALMTANAEFAEEVARLYKEEEKWEESRKESEKENEIKRKDLEIELGELGREVEKERQRWQEEVRNLQERLSMVTTKEHSEEEIKCHSHEECKNTIDLLQTTLSAVKEDLENERKRRKDSEDIVNRLSQELEKDENQMKEMKNTILEMKNINTNAVECEELVTLQKQHKQLKSENYENLIAYENLKKTLVEHMEKEEHTKKENEKLTNDKKKLEQNLKALKDHENDKNHRDNIDTIKADLHNEREKVSNLLSRHSQLGEENRELREENNRLYSKTSHLEQLMGQEVTDINEILSVINNIQVKQLNETTTAKIDRDNVLFQASQTLINPKVVAQSHERHFI